jgi:hypothetical protein
VRRVASTVLLVCFVLLGTGAAEYWHNLGHAREDGRLAAGGERGGGPADPAPRHDDSNCVYHARLHAPFMSVGILPLLICLGLLVAFLSSIAPPLITQRVPLRLDCRGPPAH